MEQAADMNFLYRLRDIYRNIDRCLDIGDPREFRRAGHELRDVLRRLREVIDDASVADIAVTRPGNVTCDARPGTL
jgi:hypothetical protein